MLLGVVGRIFYPNDGASERLMSNMNQVKDIDHLLALKRKMLGDPNARLSVTSQEKKAA
jgi:hypothetical protein